MRAKALFLALALTAAAAGATERPVVLELFTSQGCSSCPPADALLSELGADPRILPLSLHVHYWDYLGWKDPFSSEANTNRQRAYARALRDRGVYTPQMVVDGAWSAVGADAGAVSAAIRRAKEEHVGVPVTLRYDPAARVLRVHAGAAEARAAQVVAMRFQKTAATEVLAGENRGRTLTHLNNVVEIIPLGAWNGKAADYETAFDGARGEGMAILVQTSPQGAILGAASYGGTP